MNKYFVILLTLTSCFSLVDETPIVQSAPVRKQKHQIAVLQKKLASAEASQKKALSEVEKIQEEIQQTQLTLIRKQVDRYEGNPQKWVALGQSDPSALFFSEREELHQIIQTGPSPAAFDAQVELDRILRFITQLSDELKL